ncbi:hypothetical protein NC796_03765 [Aliifodinibius sp. S!AR15-10]|uniref:DUF5672 family protein n=1 Tax=Aliifodinibius sp. S!AR15-10 TaxID=2950437 RepID=UPI0028558A92|nr:DUF5672 family protein [Aliifodinibius sp. S!AR15-10]MDR8390243.1 hypothetical protein [Aliifodinibius sp. S!AR15-10]
MDKNLVAIVIPLSNRPDLTESEKISLKHLEYYLSGYDTYFLAPMDLEFSYKDYPVCRIDNIFFGSLEAHNHLLFSGELYKRFSDYKYILLYHLDSLVFKDSIEKWCSMDFDYIAPPWIKGPDLPWLEENGVGNGGFSLRKVDAFSRLLNSKAKWITKNDIIPNNSNANLLRTFSGIAKNTTRYLIPGLNSIDQHIKTIVNSLNEDRFLWKYAKKYYPEFKIAPVDLALEFAFESNVELCYEMNDKEIPFGCHAWERYNKEFWEPHLLNSEFKK